jgi:hypothetical protein
MTDTVESLVAYCRQDGRVCPQPPLWNELWEMLPNRQRVGSGWEPPLPLILAAWHTTPALSKMLRLEDHIRWAEQTASGCCSPTSVTRARVASLGGITG